MNIRIASILVWAATSACSIPPSARAQDRLYAEPMIANGFPYLPSEGLQRKLPVVLRGFSAVSLRDQRQWISGQPQWQLVFDGQLYWFAGPRDREIFAAAPNEYAPVLGGDCIVTFVETGSRTPGRLELGLVHKGRMYFFASEAERERFQTSPQRYADGDLANAGRCIVSQIEDHKSVAGLPATVAMVNGLRYLFAGDFQRRLFVADPAHYGVRPIVPEVPEGSIYPPANAGTKNAKESKSRSDDRSPGDLEDVDDQPYAMEGYCAVSIQEQGVWVRGSFENHFDFEGKRYVFAGEKQKQMFVDDPQKYVPMLGGDCIVSKVDDANEVPGSVYHSLVFENKLYLFSGPEEVKKFKADPARYVASPTEPEDEVAPLTAPQGDAGPDADVLRDPSEEGNSLREGRDSERRRGRVSR